MITFESPKIGEYRWTEPQRVLENDQKNEIVINKLVHLTMVKNIWPPQIKTIELADVLGIRLLYITDQISV